jgi:hypothetical protein
MTHATPRIVRARIPELRERLLHPVPAPIGLGAA